MSVILSIDPGCRNTGYSVTQEEKIIHLEAFVTKSTDFYTPYYLREHYEKIDELLTKFNPDLVALEGPSIASSNYQFAIGGLHGLYTLTLYNLEIPCIIAPPAKWKKFVVGKGNATKQEISRAVKEKLSIESKLKQDVVDAIAINIFAIRALQLMQDKSSASKLEEELFLLGKGVIGSSTLNFNLKKLWQKHV